MLRIPLISIVASLCVLTKALHAEAAEAYQLDAPVTLLTGGVELYFSQSRAAVIPEPWRVLMTTQETKVQGSHGFRDLFMVETADGRTWSNPAAIPTLKRLTEADGVERVVGDVCPKWHAKTRTVLFTGKTFNFKQGVEDRAQEKVSYGVLDPATNAWSASQILQLPERDASGAVIVAPNSGCVQRIDLEDGSILLPFRYRRNTASADYVSAVALCSYDGRTLTYLKHGNEMTDGPLYEPSLARCKGRFFLTMRSSANGYIARSDDGLSYSKPAPWTFDDGSPLLSANTQQHWIATSNALHLVYTRKTGSNDHIMRNRAPLFIAEVDPEKLCVIRATERIAIPENNAEMGGGFGVVHVSPTETWLITSEMLLMPPRRNDRNKVILAKIHWPTATTPFPLN